MEQPIVVVPTLAPIVVAAAQHFAADRTHVRKAREALGPASFEVWGRITLRGALKIREAYEAAPAMRASWQHYAAHSMALERERFSGVRADSQLAFHRAVLERCFAQVEVDLGPVERFEDLVRREFAKTIPKETRLGRAEWTDTGTKIEFPSSV